MQRLSTCRGGLAAVAAAVLLSPLGAFAQGTGNDACVSSINGDARKVVDARGKADRSCVKQNAGGDATPCIDGDDVRTEIKKSLLASRYASECAGNPPAFGVAPGGATAIHLAAVGAANDLAHDLFGDTVEPGTGAENGCQEKVLQRADQLVTARWKAFSTCKKKSLPGLADAGELAAQCLGGPGGTQPDPKGKLNQSGIKLSRAVQSQCLDADVSPVAAAFPGVCAGASNLQFESCVRARAACRFCLAVKAADGLPNAALDCDLFDDGTRGSCGPQPTPTPTPTPTPSNPPTTPRPTPTRTPTPVPTPTPTQSPPLPDFCQPLIGLPALAQVPFTLTEGSPFCGGAALDPPASPPLTGVVEDGSGGNLGDLGLGCLYAGAFEGIRLPTGGTAKLDVVGIQLLPPAITLGGSAGSGPFDCTRGAGPGRHCLNGAPGTDGMGACTTTADCGPGTGRCQLDANCFFGPPIPILVAGTVGACVLNAFQTDLCGEVSLLPLGATLTSILSARVYLTNDAESPCPQCIAGQCTAGKNAGDPCTPLGSENTSIDCPPNDATFLTTLTVPVASLSTGTSTLQSDDGFFCPGQTVEGAFGVPEARSITEVGAPPGGGGLLSMTLGAAFCVPASGNPVIDSAAALPGPGALSAAGELDISQVLPLLP